MTAENDRTEVGENGCGGDCACEKRRSFLVKISLGASALAGIALGVPAVGFFVAPFLKSKPNRWQSVGRVDEFKVGDTVEVVVNDPSPLPWAGVIAKTAAWLRRESESEFIAFAVNCTHLGCPVRWEGKAELFLCPCHGGVYAKDGEVTGGPPPRPLTRYQTRILAGQVEVLTSELPIG